VPEQPHNSFLIIRIAEISPGHIFLFSYKDSLKTSGELIWILA